MGFKKSGGGFVEVGNGTCKVTVPKPHAYDTSYLFKKF